MTPFAGAEAAGTTPGAALASARERLGLSIADVAGQMRISPRQVEAIEADRYGDLPGAVFVRGFVRNYARLLKLDPLPLLHALEPALGQGVPLRAHAIAGALPVPARRGRTLGWLGLLAVIVACVLAAGLYEYLRPQPKDVAVRAAPVPPSQVQSTAEPKKPSDPPVTPVPPQSESMQSTVSVAAQGEPQPQAAPDPPPTTPAAVPDASTRTRPARIGIQFVRESWIEIRDRTGNVVYSGTGQADSVRVLEVQAPVDVLVGNAGGVRITYNDRPFDVTPHATRNIARFSLE